jgi:WD40 repeat protein
MTRIIDCATQTSTFDFKAHANEITNMTIFEGQGNAFAATSARDRMVQVFHRKSDTWELMQTLDEHVGAVTGVLFSKNGDRLVSMSSDRSIVVRELASLEEVGGELMRAFVMLRTVILKATPVSIAWDVDQEEVLLVSTIDRSVHKYDLRTGQCLSSFRASDNDGSDAVVLSSLVHIPRTWGSPFIAGVSSTDKSIRLYDESGTLLARDWGHTEGLTDIALLQNDEVGDDSIEEYSLVTVAVDGTIFLWGLLLQHPNRQESRSMDLLGPSTPTNQSLLASKPPLRRVFSQSELAKFRSSEDDQTTPTGNRSPKLRKKTSKFSLTPTPKLDPSPISSTPRDRLAGTSSQATLRRNYNRSNRSPSPPSPRHPQLTKRRSSVDVRLRSKAPVSEFGSLGALTESLLRTLRAYRRRLANSNDSLNPDLVREVERELALTTRALGEKSSGTLNESVMQKLLDQYTEKLLATLDEKIAASVAFRVRENSESGADTALASPALQSPASAFPTVASPTLASPVLEKDGDGDGVGDGEVVGGGKETEGMVDEREEESDGPGKPESAVTDTKTEPPPVQR